jgi:hypothetical protein
VILFSLLKTFWFHQYVCDLLLSILSFFFSFLRRTYCRIPRTSKKEMGTIASILIVSNTYTIARRFHCICYQSVIRVIESACIIHLLNIAKITCFSISFTRQMSTPHLSWCVMTPLAFVVNLSTLANSGSTGC